MHSLGPYEPAPHLAVGVSGGPDSLALARLADGWARARGGRITALTVDHRLRAASTDEAAQVAAWMAQIGVAHVTLPWTGAKPATGVQAAAREARYRLLSQWCRASGVLHLLLGHHARDQAETVLLRLARGSGLHGLAGMAPLLERAEVRLLRPLLSFQPEELRAFLQACGGGWLDDPSNRDPRFGRARLRRFAPSLAAAGLGPEALLDARRAFARARAQDEAHAAALAARACRWHPEGYAEIDRQWLHAEAPEAARLLARLLASVGGTARPTQAEVAARALHHLLANGTGATAAATVCGRCHLLAGRTRLLICRERRLLPAPFALSRLGEDAWDGRFRLRARPGTPQPRADYEVRPANREDVATVLGAARARRLPVPVLPARVLATLPVLADADGLALFPHLGYVRPDLGYPHSAPIEVVWQPRLAITGPGCFFIP